MDTAAAPPPEPNVAFEALLLGALTIHAELSSMRRSRDGRPWITVESALEIARDERSKVGAAPLDSATVAKLLIAIDRRMQQT